MKKIISLLLSLCLILGLAFTASAAVETGEEEHLRTSFEGVTVLEDGTVLATDSWNKVIWKISGGKAEIFAITTVPSKKPSLCRPAP